MEKHGKTGLETRCILTSTSFRFGWRVHLASDFLFFFSHSPRASPIHPLFFHLWFHYFSFLNSIFSNYFLIVLQMLQGMCAFSRMEAFPGGGQIPPSHNGKEVENNNKLRMLVQGGPSLDLSPLMPWPWQFFVCFLLMFFVCFSIPWVGPGLLF